MFRAKHVFLLVFALLLLLSLRLSSQELSINTHSGRDWNLYWMVFDPRTDNEAIHGSLSGDIADIYRDLKDGIVLKETNEVPASETIFEWRFGFTSRS